MKAPARRISEARTHFPLKNLHDSKDLNVAQAKVRGVLSLGIPRKDFWLVFGRFQEYGPQYAGLCVFISTGQEMSDANLETITSLFQKTHLSG